MKIRGVQETTGGRDCYGLGLAIAKRAIEEDGAEVAASNRQTGGLCIEIRLSVTGSAVQ